MKASMIKPMHWNTGAHYAENDRSIHTHLFFFAWFRFSTSFRSPCLFQKGCFSTRKSFKFLPPLFAIDLRRHTCEVDQIAFHIAVHEGLFDNL